MSEFGASVAVILGLIALATSDKDWAPHPEYRVDLFLIAVGLFVLSLILGTIESIASRKDDK